MTAIAVSTGKYKIKWVKSGNEILLHLKQVIWENGWEWKADGGSSIAEYIDNLLKK
jgi:hypothetical protein